MGTRNSATDVYEVKDSRVTANTPDGTEVRGALMRYTRFHAAFEVHGPALELRASEVLDNFKIVLGGHTAYAGRAVVHGIVNAGSAFTIEVSLHEAAWVAVVGDGPATKQVCAGFRDFLNEWQKFYLVSEEYKVIMADLQTFLAELRLWVDQVELSLQSESPTDRPRIQRELAQELRGPVGASMANMFERFEIMAADIPEELRPAHRAFGQRQLHPYLLCAPFIHRTFAKPLGYAGDYEMMNMICRDALEGDSLYAQLMNAFLLDQIGPQAVRNRVGFLQERMVNETARATLRGGTAKVFSIACGPAREAQNFVAESALANQTELRLLDFNEETLRYAGERVEEMKRKHGRRTVVKLTRNSVQNLLKISGKPQPTYDLIYCSGLYDYLSDRVIKAVNSYLYDILLPGGLLVVGNFAPNTPVRNFIEHFLEWFLIYRDNRQLAALAPDHAPEGQSRVTAEPTGTNIFLEVRKPA